MKTGNPIKFGIDEALNPAHFQRKSSTWYRYLDETILVVNLQRSNYGRQYYINLGVAVKNPLPHKGQQPKESDCHIRARVENLVPNEHERLRRLLNLEDSYIDDAQRQQGIAVVISTIALPFLIQCSTQERIIDADSKGHLSQAMVHKSLRESVAKQKTSFLERLAMWLTRFR